MAQQQQLYSTWPRLYLKVAFYLRPFTYIFFLMHNEGIPTTKSFSISHIVTQKPPPSIKHSVSTMQRVNIILGRGGRAFLVNISIYFLGESFFQIGKFINLITVLRAPSLIASLSEEIYQCVQFLEMMIREHCK